MTDLQDTETFHLVIPRNCNSEVLLRIDSGSYSLPQVEIPKQRRLGEFLTKRVNEEWGLEAVCLFDPAWEARASLDWPFNCHVLEARAPNWIPPNNFRWIGRRLITLETLKSLDEFQALERSLQLADAFNAGTRPGPFAKAGWIDDLMASMEPHLRPLHLTLTGHFTQLNVGPFFALIRFETNERAVWFKAVGEPNLREYTITQGLMQECPEYLPRIIAMKPNWHGWLMEDVGGGSLRNTASLDEWRRAASALASLQIKLIGKQEWLLEIGCKDRRLSRALCDIDPFLECMAELMLQQPKTPPAILNREELAQLGDKLKDTYDRLLALDIPDSLVHGDINSGNIRLYSDGCVFIDWAEGCLGLPFVSFEHLLACFRREHPEQPMWEDKLRNAYTEQWKTILSSEQISESMLLTPGIAVLCYALSGGGWRDSDRLRNPNFAKHMRSLVRRMRSEVYSKQMKESVAS